MKIMNEYTYYQIKQNKRHTLSILFAVTIASALLFSLCIFAFSFWNSKVEETKKLEGDWHGELFTDISGDSLDAVLTNPEVETVMLKGSWYTAQLPFCKRPYLLLRDGNQAFWSDMNLKNTITEGHVPKKEGEIVIAKQFFLDNEGYAVGDCVTLPVGTRMLGSEALGTRAYRQEGETFCKNETQEFTIVGKMDVSGASAYPGYIAMGYLDMESIQPSDSLTVYMRFDHPRKTYRLLPEIAEATGLTMNSKGQYHILFHSSLLMYYGIVGEGTLSIQILVLILMAVIILVLVSGTFILIIYNAFSLSAGSRTKELSIMKSIGATPRQIKYSVLYEGFLLWLIQIPAGLGIGYWFSTTILKEVNRILSVTENYVEMKLAFSVPVLVAALFISLITVLISASIPAGKMAKIPAVEGIGQIAEIRKMRDHKILFRLFGMEGELAGRQFSANRKSLKTAILSLSLCIALVISYLSVITIYNVAEDKDSDDVEYDVSADLRIMEEPDENLIRALHQVDEVKKIVIHRQAGMATIVTRQQESEEFAAIGGFPGVDLKYSLEKLGKNYKMNVQLIGLDEASFLEYCNQVNTDPNEYTFDDSVKKNVITGILYNASSCDTAGSYDPVEIPLLSVKEGDVLSLSEQVDDLAKGHYECDVVLKAVTDKEPGMAGIHKYGIGIIVPMDSYQQVVSQFSEERVLEVNHMELDYQVTDRENPKAATQIEKLCNYYLGSDDYAIWSLKADVEYRKLKQRATAIVIYAIAFMFGMVGLFNAITTITSNLMLHRREYAMLRSIGLTPGGLNRMLFLEGTLFVISPLFCSLVVILPVTGWMMNMTSTTLSEYFTACPVGSIVIYIVVMVMVIFGAYLFCSGKIKKNNVIESIQNEII